jgi:serine/threonine protein kinase
MATRIEVGSTFAGYRIESVLGRGGMGVVFKAEQTELGRKVALKVIAPELASDPVFQERFRRESKLAASIEHPNAIPIYEARIADQETLYLVMRYVDGVDLSTMIQREGPLDPARAARIVEQVAGALDEAHARGLVHRDVKPGNVIVESRRGGEQAYLTDFGLTKRADETSGVTKTGHWVGTFDYASPEQIQGKRVDARCDVYSLGCLLFQGLTGRVPFEREADVAKLYAHLNDEPPVPSTIEGAVPPELDRVVARAMAKDRGARFQSAGDLGRAAVASAAGEAVTLPERTVATGEAAPISTPAEATPVSAPETEATIPAMEPPTSPAEPPPTTVAEEPPTRRIPPGPPAEAAPARVQRGGRRNLVIAGVAGLAAVGVAAALVLGGGDGGDEGQIITPGGGDGDQTGAGPGGGGGQIQPTRFAPYDGAAGFTVEVPKGWSTLNPEEERGTAEKTEFVSPELDASVTVVREPPDPPSVSAEEARAERQQEPGYEFIGIGPSDFAGGEGYEFLYRTRDTAIGPASVIVYLLDPAQFGGELTFRVRGAATEEARGLDFATEVAQHAVDTLEAR